MAGADVGIQRRPWDLSRRAASFLRMARLALAGAAPAQLHAEEEAVGGHICDPYYKSISTEDDDLESDWLWLEEDEAELLVGDEDGSTARGGFSSEISTDTRGGGGGAPLNQRSQLIRQNRPATAGGAALRPENNAAAAAVLVAESSDPLVPRRAAKRANDAEMVHHPFGCDRRGSESSSLLLVSS